MDGEIHSQLVKLILNRSMAGNTTKQINSTVGKIMAAMIKILFFLARELTVFFLLVMST